MKLEICSINYCIPLTPAQYKKLEEKNFADVWSDMRRAGADKIEYSGHFGSFIFFTAEEKDTKNILVIVKKLVK